jgi:hypothetical protein
MERDEKLPVCINSYEAFCQQTNIDPNIQLPVDEKMALYFDIFRDGTITQGASRFADYLAGDFGTDVIPYLREYLKNADYFHYISEPRNVTLDLAAYVIYYLHVYTDPVFTDIVEKYDVDKDEIQWFVDQYKGKLDQYIRVNKVIDRVVLAGENNLRYVAGYHLNWVNGQWVGGNEIEKYGYPNFFDGDDRYKISEIKKYYEERLGIKNIRIVTR